MELHYVLHVGVVIMRSVCTTTCSCRQPDRIKNHIGTSSERHAHHTLFNPMSSWHCLYTNIHQTRLLCGVVPILLDCNCTLDRQSGEIPCTWAKNSSTNTRIFPSNAIIVLCYFPPLHNTMGNVCEYSRIQWNDEVPQLTVWWRLKSLKCISDYFWILHTWFHSTLKQSSVVPLTWKEPRVTFHLYTFTLRAFPFHLCHMDKKQPAL